MAYLHPKIAIFTAFLCVLSGLPAESSAESIPVINESIKEEAVIVIAGGFGSCPDDFIFDRAIRAAKTADMYQRFINRVSPSFNADKNFAHVNIFSICYSGLDNLASSLSQSISGRYAWNIKDLRLGAEGVRTFRVNQGKLLTDLEFLSPLKLELKTYIQSRKDLGLVVRLYVIGHSYGGFTGIQIADFLVDDLSGLFTIDPISMFNCQAKDMALKVYNTLALKHPGCKSAPEDAYSLASVQHLLQRNKEFPKASWWYNTYQKEFP
jgi:hypothetical protein